MVQNLDQLRAQAARAIDLNTAALVEWERRQQTQLSHKRRQGYEKILEEAGDEDETEDGAERRRELEYTLAETEAWEAKQEQKRRNVAHAQSLDYGEAAARHYERQIRAIEKVQSAADPVQALIDELNETTESRQAQRRNVATPSAYINDANRQFNVRLERLTKRPPQQPWTHFEF